MSVARGSIRTSFVRAIRLATLALVSACHVVPASEDPSGATPVALTLSILGDQVFVAEGAELWAFSPSIRRGLGEREPLAGPCDVYLDLETFADDVIALCDDGRIFMIDAKESLGARPQDWQLVHVDAGLRQPVRAEGLPLVALQRSDELILAVREDGGLQAVVGHGAKPPAASTTTPATSVEQLDRFRGPERGGAGQLAIATFEEDIGRDEASLAYGFVLRHSVELIGTAGHRAVACRIYGRGYRIIDIAFGRELALAAVLVDPHGRSWIAYVDADVPLSRQLWAGLHEPRTGRRTSKAIRCTRW